MSLFPELDKENEKLEVDQKWLFRQYPIGARFWYMGTEFSVSNHMEFSIGYSQASIWCDYRLSSGEFKEKQFFSAVLKTL